MDKQSKRGGYEMRVGRKYNSAQSGSGRSNLKPDKHRDSSKYAQTMADRHGIAKTQKIKAEDQDDRRVTIKAEEGRVHDSAEDLVDHPRQGQDNTMPPSQANVNQSTYSILETPAQAAQAMQAAQGGVGAPQMFPRPEPVRPNRIADAKRKKLEYDILMSTNNARPRKHVSSRPLAERITFPQEEKPCRPQGENASTAGMSHMKLYANCGGDGHLLAHCITAKDGAIRICFFCRDNNHLTDECERFRRLSLIDKVKLLVVDRGNMPALATKKPWWGYLYDLLDADDPESIPDFAMGFPWTVPYAVSLFSGKVGKGINVHQATFDYSHDRSVLPKNKTLCGLEDVWDVLWQREFRVRPYRLDEIKRQSTGSHPEVNDSVREWLDNVV
ncbi:hypothetical protein FDENT_13164 [Fusarium denticulatum]|uniref:CCHC-type domain-containing protein n=1 Tax=Fusarium denticulatum TaxID=48507 RepID=A0A8H5T5K6_9HYPO|nr:hypothetical protein FDENT_13164 [Fusarium denticulatum]